MTEREIITNIDGGANFYYSLLGWARHMESEDTGFYSYIKPKTGEQGLKVVYDIRLENESPEKRREVAEEIKAFRSSVWLDLMADDELYKLIYEREKYHGPAMGENAEVYMAMLPEEKSACPESEHQINIVESSSDFALWAMMTDNLSFGGRPIIHPLYHYPLCQSEMMKSYILCVDGAPAAVAATMNNMGTVSLEFVGVQPEYEGQGLEEEICRRAVSDAFDKKARIITLRAKGAKAAKLYESIGFKAYNAFI